MTAKTSFIFCLLIGFTFLVMPQEIPAQEEPNLDDLESVIKKQQEQLEKQNEITEKQRKDIEEMRKAFEEMQKQLEEQNKLTEEQRKKIDEMNELLLSVHNRMQEVQEKIPDTSVSAALEKRVKELETMQQEASEIPPEVVSAGEFPGSIKVPGSEVAIKIGGRVKFSMVYNLQALGVDDRFLTSAIPIRGTEAAGEGARLTMSARSSRLNFDVRTPAGEGYMRAFIEGDFSGDDEGFDLRHAFGQYSRVLAGKTWSTSADPQARPEGLDFEGLNSRNLIRQAQLRYSFPLENKMSLALAIEDPASDITDGENVNLVPDFITRFRWEEPYANLGHLQASVILRQIRAEPNTNPDRTEKEFAYGFSVSGKLATPSWSAKDNLVFQFNFGEGIGRYINDLEAEGGQDAWIDPSDERLSTLPIFAAYAGYQHWWEETIRSNLLCGYVRVHNRSFQPGDAYHHTERYSLNAVWSPVPSVDVGIEALYGIRENKDHGRGSSSQIQFAALWRF